MVPRTGRAGVDVRLMPGQRSEDVLEAIADIIEAKAPPELETEIVVTADAPAAFIEPDHPLVGVAKRWTHAVTGKEWPAVGAGPTNEGYMFIERGIPVLCGFGPTGGNPHAYDEYVEVASLEQTISIYAGVVGDYVGG